MKTRPVSNALRWLQIGGGAIMAGLLLLTGYSVFFPHRPEVRRHNQVTVNGRQITIDRKFAETENKPWELVWRSNRKREDAVLQLVQIYDQIGESRKELDVFRFLHRNSLNGLPPDLLERYEELSEQVGTNIDRHDADSAVVASTQFGQPQDIRLIKRDEPESVHANACAARALIATDTKMEVEMAREAVRLKPRNALYRCIAGEAFANDHLYSDSYQQFLIARKLGYLSNDAKQQMDFDLIRLSAAKQPNQDLKRRTY